MALSTNPVGGVGITLGYRTASTGAFTSLVQLADDCEFSGWEVTEIAIKPLSATVVTKVPGRIDYGTFSGSFYNVLGDAGVVEMYTLFAARTIVYWQLQLSDDITTITNSSTYVYQGFLKTLTPGNFTGDDTPSLAFEISITGAVTATAGT